jgi:hypothetical protein
MNQQGMNQNNGQNMNYQQVNFSKMNPRTFDPKIKTQIVNHNIYHSGFGNYKVCPVMASVKFPYKNAYNPGTINSICKVMVHNLHPIDVASNLCDHGLNSLTANHPIPAIIYPMGKEFTGMNTESREGVHDETMFLRSNYPYVIKKQPELLQTKDGQKSVVYSNPITVIRDPNYTASSYDDIFKVGVITVPYERKNDLLTDIIEDGEKKRENKILTSVDILNFQMCVENAIQAAICGFHNILLLPIFDRAFGVPIDDQVKVFNMCILKFGHMFKGIMICVPPYEEPSIFKYLEEEIIKPQILTKDLDNQYMAKSMAKRLEKNDDSDEPPKNGKNNTGLMKKMANMDDEERMKTLRQMIKKNRETKKRYLNLKNNYDNSG